MSEEKQESVVEKKPVYFVIKDPNEDRGEPIRDLSEAKRLAAEAGPDHYIEVMDEQEDGAKPVRRRVIRQEDFGLEHTADVNMTSETRIAFSMEDMKIQMYYNSGSDCVTVRVDGLQLPPELSIVRNPLWTEEKLVDRFMSLHTYQELKKIYEIEHEKYLKDWQQWNDDVAMRRI